MNNTNKLNLTDKNNRAHDPKYTRLYRIWCGMRYRCENPKHPSYKNYGERGIKVCPEWQTFENFMSWALENGYRDDLTLERLDNAGGYNPDNCTWADRRTQNNNTRRNHKLTYQGRTQTIAQWAREKEQPYSTLWARINALNWSVEKALETPVRPRNKKEGLPETVLNFLLSPALHKKAVIPPEENNIKM